MLVEVELSELVNSDLLSLHGVVTDRLLDEFPIFVAHGGQSDALNKGHVLSELLDVPPNVSSDSSSILMVLKERLSQLETLLMPLVDVLLHILIDLVGEGVPLVLNHDNGLHLVSSVDKLVERLERLL